MPHDGEEMAPTRPACEATGRTPYHGLSPPPSRRPSIWGLDTARAFRDGIDVHKKESQIYILAEGGEVIERRIRTEAERFAASYKASLGGSWKPGRRTASALEGWTRAST
jgi:hypothetical protein